MLAVALCLAAAAALTGVWAIIALPLPLRGALTAAVLWGAATALARHALRRGKRARVEIRFLTVGLGGGGPGRRRTRRAGGTILTTAADGTTMRATVESMFFSAPLVVLRIRELHPADLLSPPQPPGWRPRWRARWRNFWKRPPNRALRRRRETIIVPADCMDAETHRRFRIRARRAWSAAQGMKLARE